LALAGCSSTNAIQTDRPYAPGEGVRVALGDVRAENLLVVGTAQGEPGALSGALANGGREDVDVTVSVGGDDTRLTVPARGAVLIGTGSSTGESVQVGAVDAAPGSFTAVSLTIGGASPYVVDVPVVDGTVPPFDSVLRD
jgi:hypothetical protein